MISAILLIIAVVFVMFLLHLLAKNDFVLLRKNVSLHELFDTAILSLMFGLFIARVFYIIDVQNFSLFNPFRFFHLIKLPGLSLYGFFVGIIPLMYYLLRKKKVTFRIYDIFFISLLPIFIVSLVTRPYSLFLPDYVVRIILFFVGVVLLWVLVKFYQNYTLRDGSIALIIFMLVSLDLFLYEFTIDHASLLLSLTLSQILAVVLFVISLGLFVKNQHFFKR